MRNRFLPFSLCLIFMISATADLSAQQLTRTIKVVSSAGARALVDACSAWAEKNKQVVAIAVIDWGGNVIDSHAMEGAAANALPDHVPPEEQEERLFQLMQVQQGISAARLKHKIGKTIRVLVDEVGHEGAIARSSADAPEIDGLVYVKKDRSLKVGDVADVRVTDSDSYDLWAEKV